MGKNQPKFNVSVFKKNLQLLWAVKWISPRTAAHIFKSLSEILRISKMYWYEAVQNFISMQAKKRQKIGCDSPFKIWCTEQWVICRKHALFEVLAWLGTWLWQESGHPVQPQSLSNPPFFIVLYIEYLLSCVDFWRFISKRETFFPQHIRKKRKYYSRFRVQ